MLSEMMRIAPIESLRLCKGAEARFGQQHAARKNIRLDEIGAGCIAIEYGVIDADILDRCPAARLQQAVNGGQIIGPICLSHGFDHLHAGDGVILADSVPIIGQKDVLTVTRSEEPTSELQSLMRI